MERFHYSYWFNFFSRIHPQEAERRPTSRASPSISISQPRLFRRFGGSKKEKRKGLQVDMKSLSPAFSPNWMAGSVLTTTNPVITTNPAIIPVRSGPLGPLGFNFSQHGPTTRPSVERTAEKAFMLSDRV